jgi:NADH-quinone oxidoreductase subunit C
VSEASTNPNMAAGEQAALIDADVEIQLPDELRALRDRLVEAFGDLQPLGFRGELTLVTDPGQLLDVLAFCRDEDDVRCELLADLSGVHWPGGRRVENAQETTGWPTYTSDDEPGRIEVDYVLYSITHNHRLRLRVLVDDADARLPSAVDIYASANVMEREVYDFFGVVFDGHPNLVRILMPDQWEGHPHRKDYPIGGVEVQYFGATIPPPDQRLY